MSAPPALRMGVAIGALALAYGYFIYTGENYNLNSRLGLTYALVEEGRLSIDTYHDREGTRTGDKALFEGHYYTDKAIGSSVLAALAYAPLRLVARAAHVDLKPHQWAYLLNLGINALPAAMVGGLMWLLCAALTGETLRSGWAAASIALGTMWWPFSTVLFGHVLAAGFLFGAFLIAWRMREHPMMSRACWRWLLGTLLGWAVITEYTTAPAAAGIGCYVLWVTRRHRTGHGAQAWLTVLAGAALPLGLQLLNNALCFGSPWTNAYHHFARPDIQAGMRHAMVGIGWPRLEVLYYLTVHPVRGLFIQSPVLLAAVAGYAWLLRDVRWRAEGCLSLGLLSAFLLMNAGFVWWTGGASFGPRYLIPMLPFLCLPLAALPRRAFPAVLVLGLISMAQMLMVTAANPLIWNKTIRNFERGLGPSALPWHGVSPIYDHALPALRAGYVQPNLGTYAGLVDWASLVPLGIVLLGAGGWLWWKARAS
jgi:hypothetical protein